MDVYRKVRRLLVPLFASLCLLAALPARALEINGVAPFSELGGEIYLAALHLDARTSDENALFADNRERKMEVRFSAPMSKRRWVTNWMQSIAINNNRDSLVGSAEELSEILSAFADNLAPGDSVEIHFVPGDGTAIRINGTTLASGKSAQIFNLFLSSWIGAVPPSSHFKNALLGTANSTADQGRFSTLAPSPARIAAVKAWAAEEEVVEEEAVEETPAPEVATEAIPEPPKPEKPEPAVAPPAAPPAVAETPAPEPEPEPAPAPAPEPAAAPAPELAADDNEDEVDLSVEGILAQQEYATSLIRKVYGNVQYPAISVKRGQEGSVRVSLMVARNGTIAAIRMLDESKYSALNKEAVRAIEAAAPFNPLPGSIREPQLEIVVPITFKLAG
jgi:protein TonB